MQTSLNLEIDYVATAKKVTNFLDKKLDRYLALSGKTALRLKVAQHGRNAESTGKR